MRIRAVTCVETPRRLFLLTLAVILFWPFVAAADVPLRVSEQGYRLGPNDVIRIQVFGEEDLTVEGKIDGDGKINFPLLGPFEVGGQTPQEVRQALITRLASGYVRQPNVTVYVVRYRNLYVSGEVRTPGAYAYEEGLTVQKAISLAGGFTEKSDRRGIKIVRELAGRAEPALVESDTLVLPDDTIIVSQIKKFYVTGEVVRPGAFPYEEGLTMHKALSIAGGLTDKAEKRDLKITRVATGMAETLRAEPEMAVLPDDIIVAEPQTHKFYTSGEVKTPGAYPYREGLTVHKAVAMAGGLTEKAERGEFRVLRHANGHEETVTVNLETIVLPDDIIVVAESRRFYVSGEVKNAGRYLYEKDLTVQKAISIAGGFTDKASEGRTKVLRVINGQQQSIRVNLEDVMLPDDIIVVPRRFF